MLLVRYSVAAGPPADDVKPAAGGLKPDATYFTKRGILHLLWGSQSWLRPPFQAAFRAIYECSWSERAG